MTNLAIDSRQTRKEKLVELPPGSNDWKGMRKENRELSRIEVSWPSTISTSRGSIDGEVRNVSIDGAFLHCRELPNLEENLHLNIRLPDQQHLSATAKIVRLDMGDYTKDRLSYGLAVRFVDLCDDSRRLLESAICQCPATNAEEDNPADFSANFHTQLEESNLIVETLLRCFDEKGNFDSELFLNQTDLLKSHHERVFHLLLRYLKKAENRKSRVSLINSIPVFYDRIDCARSIVRIPLTEFCHQSSRIHYSDRNMLMLATQLLRHYRKEDGLEIETTPEELLLVRKGLRTDTVELAKETLAGLDNQIRSKLSIINRYLIASLSQPYPNNTNNFSLRFIISLLREFNILLSLIGGDHAKIFIREQAFFLSNPNSPIYKHPSNKKHLDVILGLLRINIKGYLRLLDGDDGEYDHLRSLRSRIDILSLASEEARKLLLRRLSGLIETQLR